MSDQDDGAGTVSFNSMPGSIWALQDEHRGPAVAAIFRQHAINYESALAEAKDGEAQKQAFVAVQAIAGLFPTMGDPAHALIADLLDLILAAANGRTDAKLQVGRAADLSSARGLGRFADTQRHAFCRGAFTVLKLLQIDGIDGKTMSDRRCRQMIEETFARRGIMSSRSDSNRMPSPITEGGVRSSIERDDQPITAMADSISRWLAAEICSRPPQSTEALQQILDEVCGGLRL